MPQKIDVHGLFIDPETITDLCLQKRIAVFYPVFHEVPVAKPLFRRSILPEDHVLRFDHQEPYGIILAESEKPDSASFVVNYKEALFDTIFKGVAKTGKNISGHITEMLKIEISGDRQYSILQSGRNVKKTSIREIPAKVRLLSGQWVDVFMSSPGYDYQGGSPYAVTDVNAAALMIVTKNAKYVLYGAGVDASNEEVLSSYHALTEIYNEIQAAHDLHASKSEKKPLIHLPKINARLPKAQIPTLDITSRFDFKKKDSESVPTSDPISEDKE